MTDIFIKEFEIPELASGEVYLLKIGSNKFSESSLKKFAPVLGIACLNKSVEPVKVFINETNDNAFRVSGNGSRTLTGIPAWDVSVQNIGADTIASGNIILTLFSDLEQNSRYAAYAKGRGY